MSYRHRVALLAVLAGCGAVLLLSRLLLVQVIEYDSWAAEARAQAAGWIPVRARRGRIVDADGVVLANDDATFDLAVRAAAWNGILHECRYCGFHRYFKKGVEPGRCPRCRKRVMPETDDVPVFENIDRRSLRKVAEELGIPQDDLRKRIAGCVKAAQDAVNDAIKDLKGKQRERREAIVWADQGWRDRTIARDVSYEIAREVELHPDRNPAFRVVTVTARRHPGGAAFAHILGRTRVDQVRLATPDDDAAWLGVARGLSRLEARYDTELRGVPGWVRVFHDARSRTREALEPEHPIHGLDLQLTVAAADQQRALDALHGAQGALVVLNAETGAVIALASTPTYTPEDYRPTVLAWRKRKDKEGSPLIERACRSFFSPGSIMKPFTAVAALTSGVSTPETEVVCEHYFTRDDGKRLLNTLKCAGTHGRLDLRGGLVMSCNIYFQTLMRQMLQGRHFPEFEQTLATFGFGTSTGIEIEGRRTGILRFPNHWYELISAAIGQGMITVSPAQVARAYAGLATGYLPRLHLVARVGTQPTPVERTPLGVPESVLAPIRAALFEVPVRGTARDHGLERFGLACKTGTAQIPGGLYNAWLAGFAPAREGRPPIAFAMVVLNANRHGGEVCGPRLYDFFRRFYGEKPQ